MAEINVTPLVDVMLVLLIIFMVTAPLLVAGVPVDLPESRANALSQEANQVTLAIDGRGLVFLDDDAIAPGELAERIDGLRCAGRSAAERPPADHIARRPRARLRTGDGGDGRTQPRRVQQRLAGHQ